MGLTGYDERSPHHLSTGEKRRVCLAGVLACRPGLLLLDEPSSGPGPARPPVARGPARGLPATIIVASHDLAFVGRVCSRAIILDRGGIVADGPTSEMCSRTRICCCATGLA